MVGFIVRLVGYALLLGIASRIAQTLWSQNGLDGIAQLQPFHDAGVIALIAAPIVFALCGWGRLRLLCVFLAWALAGAAVTAPFVVARLAGV
ncbi:MAG TPA: hypothetical protein VGN14_04640 [Candidatus Elarobacter sp.]|jgi:hypothetical protein